MKKGFTLVEILAVIVALALVLLIAMPIVLNVMSDAKKGTFETSAYGLAKTARNECMSTLGVGDAKVVEIVFENGEIISEDMISFKGKRPDEGNIIIHTDCRVQLAISDGEWCIQKSFDSKEVTITSLEELNGECEVPGFYGTVNWETQEDGKVTATVPIVNETNVEYSKDGNNWQLSNVFENLLPGVEYTFKVKIDEIISPEEIKIKAPNVYKITYQTSTGGSVDPLLIYVISQSNATAPTTTANAGYDLVNFTVVSGPSNGNLNIATGAISNIVGNMIVKANFTIRQYTVNYQSNQGATFSPNYRTVPHGSNAAVPSITVDPGYIFSHYTVISGVGNGDLNTTTGNVTGVVGNMVIEANFTLEYTVSYTASAGGSVIPTSEMVNHSSANTGTTPSANTGYSFTNYTLTSGICNGTFNNGTGICSDVREAITVRANFTINQYIVTFNSNGGSCSPSSRVVNHGDSAAGPTSCSRTGYTRGDYSITSGECAGTFTASTGACSNVQQNITIQANWIINKYTVTYTKNPTAGGSVEPASEIVDWSGANIGPTATANEFYTFGNYSITSGSCAGTFTASTGICSNVRANMTIRANFIANTYTVTYTAGTGGTITPSFRTVSHGSSATAPTATASTGYDLIGFTITINPSNCTGYWYVDTGRCSTVVGNMTINADFDVRHVCGQNITDIRDDEVYATIQIGTQCWMAENLRYTTENCLTRVWTYSSYISCRINGGDGWDKDEVLYQWPAAMAGSTTAGAKGMCPLGWHIPTYTEWTTLKNYVNSDVGNRCDGLSSYIGKAVASTTNWNSHETQCRVGNNPSTNNLTGFNLRPTGSRGTTGTLQNVGMSGSWWASTFVYSTHADGQSLYFGNYDMGNMNTLRDTGHSVRCLRNE